MGEKKYNTGNRYGHVSRVEIGRMAFAGLLPVLYDHLRDLAGYEYNGVRYPANCMGSLDCERLVNEMDEQELEEFLAVSAIN